MILGLDDALCLDSRIVGAKAAWLARGRRIGLPVLPGIVISADESLPVLTKARKANAPLSSFWSTPFDPRLSEGIRNAAASLDEPLIVRSSSPLESRGAFSGAFTSYLDVGRDQVETAIRGCWASAGSTHARSRYQAAGLSVAPPGIAVLLQPMVKPRLGGTARVAPDGVVSVIAVAGSPAPLMQGWEPGVSILVAPDGSVVGDAGLQLVGTDIARSVAALAREAHRRIGANMCEWAASDTVIVMLQLGRTAMAVGPASLPASSPNSPEAATVARRIRRAPGALGEALVLPWALGDDSLLHPRPTANCDLDPAEALDAALRYAAELTGQAWGRQAMAAQELAKQTLRDLRGPSPSMAIALLLALAPPDVELGGQVVALLRRVREGLVQVGAAADPEAAWFVPPAAAAEMLNGGPVTAPPRIGVDAWEPFQAAAALASGQRVPGQAAVSGIGFGRACWVDGAGARTSFRARDVVVARYPVPGLGALLWDAAGLVTAGGGPAAHLFSSAESLGVPAVFGVDLDATFSEWDGGGPGYGIAVDGGEGTIAVVPW